MSTQVESKLRDRARADVRGMLGSMKGFRELQERDQLQFYKDLVGARMTELKLQSERNGHAGGNGAGRAQSMALQRASDTIDYDKLQNKRIDQAGELAGDFMQQVNFPRFVRDLLKGVFDANLEVTLKQMEAYINLMKAATASVAKFVNAIDAAASFGYLAENSGDEFGLDEDPDEGQVLVDKEGNRLATEKQMKSDPEAVDATVKAKIMDAKIAMAKEQRALLRETILMGVTRLVVERGTVKAAVIFDIKAKEKITTAQKGASKQSMSHSSGMTASGGLIGSILGGPSGGMSNSARETEISVASAKSVGSTDLAAKVTGSVEIIFKSDYFKLDNFATMYGPVGQPGAPGTPGAAGPPGAGAAPPGAPAAPAQPGAAK
jgi:hypothetical protein